MTLIRFLAALIFFCQEMLKLIQAEKKEGIQKKLKEKIDEDKKRISEAFKTKDPKVLNDVFKS